MHRARITLFATREPLPALYGNLQFADSGGLKSYGVNLTGVANELKLLGAWWRAGQASLSEDPAARLCGMKTVGTQTRSEFEADPLVAWQRGAALDATLYAGMPWRLRGVWRLTHLQMNQLDLARQLEQAAKVNRRHE